MKRRWKMLICIFLLLTICVLTRMILLQMNTDLPKLCFKGNILDLSNKKEVRDITVSYSDGTESFEGFAEIKLQGTSSLNYDKKNYTLKLFQDADHQEKLKIDMGWGEQSEYCLKANWIDKTHARNVVTARLVTQMQRRYDVLSTAPRNGAVDGFPVEIYLNGRFHGLYTFNIPKDEWQFNMDGDNPNHIVVCGEDWEDAALFKAMPNFESWEVEVGEENDETLQKMNKLFDFVINSSDEEFKADFEKHIDLNAALNYYIMTDVAYLNDNRAKNMILATYDGEKWYPSLYDLDTSRGSDFTGKKLLPYESEFVYMKRSTLFSRMQNVFAAELAERYFDLRSTVLSEENIVNEFKSFTDGIPVMSYLKERLRWGFRLPGYGLKQIESYLDTTMERMDQYYQEMLESGY